MGSVRAPLTEDTALEVDRLISEGVPPHETEDLRREVRLALATAPADSGVRHRHLRRRLRVLKRSAAPGPSSWRNGHLQAVGQVASGVQALARWAALWHRAALSAPAAALWSAACVSPVDSGERPLGPDDPPGTIPRRKIRPIACSEAPVKFAEGILIDAQMGAVTVAMEPMQLGCGAADGSGIIISLVRTWTGAMGEQPSAMGGPDGVAALDLENAYGLAFRSSCLRGLRARAPAVAVMAAAQWQSLAVGAWQRAPAGWRHSLTHRGGWQGSRLMQVAFCAGLEDSCAGAAMFAAPVGQGSAGSGGVRDPPRADAPPGGAARPWAGGGWCASSGTSSSWTDERGGAAAAGPAHGCGAVGSDGARGSPWADVPPGNGGAAAGAGPGGARGGLFPRAGAPPSDGARGAPPRRLWTADADGEIVRDLEELPVPVQRPVIRVGYQDDTYLVGAVAAILEHFPDLCRSLARGPGRA